MSSRAACSVPEATPGSKHYVVGLTGGIGSGKSLVAATLADLGAAVVDTDAIAHRLTAAGGAAIAPLRAAFGADLIDAQGALDRARMRAQAFGDEAARQRLESILHPLIAAEAEAQLARPSAAPYLLLVVPLLIETRRWLARVQRVLVIDCPVAQQIERVVATRQLARTQAEAIVARQASRAQRLAAADDVLVNAGAAADAAAAAAQLHAHYLRLAATAHESDTTL